MVFHCPNLGLPRRIVAYYLLFCIVAIAWLAGGVLITTHTVLSARGINACLSRIGKQASAVEIEYIRSGEKNLQNLVTKTRSDLRANYCSIESTLGIYLAHTNPQLVGKHVLEPEGSHLRWGSVTGTRFTDDSGVALSEFRVSLIADNQPFGALRIGVREPTIWTTLDDVAPLAPVAVLVPLGFVALGAIVLTQLTNPLAEISTQLQQLAALTPAESPVVTRVVTSDPFSLGWNRLVEYLERLQGAGGGQSLEQRVYDATTSRREGQHTDILQSLTDGVAVTDMEGRITFANRAVTALLSEDIPEGTEIKQLLCPDEVPHELEPLLDPLLASRSAVAELHRAGGPSERIVRISRQPVKEGRVQGHVWCLRDVTQQKLAEKMRDQFIDTATHELRTPLSNIKAYAETMVAYDSIDIEEQKEFCNIINSEVTRLARFVDDLLSISSMEMGSLVIEKQKVETTRLFEEVLDKVEPLMNQKAIAFVVELPEKMRELRLDKDKFVAVIVNLLGNAAKYTPSGGRVTLRVKLDEVQLQVAIEDSGVGIAADEIPRVFEKFFRSADPRVQNETGTGLGLSLAQEVVRMHGGDISIESVLNQGSTFTVTIPAE
jgi:PAS domain S-box-containing protein